MPRVSNNAEAAYVVLAWDGKNPGVTNGYDNEAEAMEEATTLKAVAPDHVDYYVCTQQGLRDKVSELTGIAVEALADPDQVIAPERQQAAADATGTKVGDKQPAK